MEIITQEQLFRRSLAHRNEQAIRDLVAFEERMEEAARSRPAFEPVPGLPAPQRVSRGILRVMVYQWLP